jgi:hypothetical protein
MEEVEHQACSQHSTLGFGVCPKVRGGARARSIFVIMDFLSSFGMGAAVPLHLFCELPSAASLHYESEHIRMLAVASISKRDGHDAHVLHSISSV